MPRGVCLPFLVFFFFSSELVAADRFSVFEASSARSMMRRLFRTAVIGPWGRKQRLDGFLGIVAVRGDAFGRCRHG